MERYSPENYVTCNLKITPLKRKIRLPKFHSHRLFDIIRILISHQSICS